MNCTGLAPPCEATRYSPVGGDAGRPLSGEQGKALANGVRRTCMTTRTETKALCGCLKPLLCRWTRRGPMKGPVDEEAGRGVAPEDWLDGIKGHLRALI